ncbi:MAG: hypothetical protein KDB80_12780 [Planctomycetes bacterium]|nr:hypothetical protein [Planctomycetota bacterium]
MNPIVTPLVASLALSSLGFAQLPQIATVPVNQGISNTTSVPFGSIPIHYQVWYSAAELGLAIGQPARISQVSFMTDAMGQTGRTIQMEMRVANSFTSSPSGTFADNFVSGETLVHPAALGQSRNFTTPTTVAGQYALVIPFQNEFVYDGSSGIVFDIRIFDNGNGGTPYPYDLRIEFLGGGRVVSLWDSTGDPIASDSDQYQQRGPRARLTWRSGLSVPYGDGCPGEGGFMPIGSTSGGFPLGGNTAWTQQLSNAPSQRAAVWIFGPSRDTWNTLTLPLSLGVIGAPNCSILARPALQGNKMTVGGGPGTGLATINTPVPPVTFTGLEFFSQWLILDPNAGNGVLAATAGLWHIFG